MTIKITDCICYCTDPVQLHTYHNNTYHNNTFLSTQKDIICEVIQYSVVIGRYYTSDNSVGNDLSGSLF